MLKFIETTGKTEDAAIQAALKQLNLDRDSVSVEVLARAKSGFLGIGSQPARVKVTYEVPDEVAAPVVEEKKPIVVEKAAPVAAPAADNTEKVEKAEKPAKAEKAEKVEKTEKKAAKTERKEVKKTEKTERKRKKEKRQPTVEAAPAAPVEAAAPAAETEPAEDRTEQIVTFLTGLLQRLDTEATPVVRSRENDIYQVELVGQGLGALIGRRGETLDAIQQLTNYAVNHGEARRVRIHIDAENYREKREESLQRLARKTAGKALKYRRNMMLEPMNAYERHVIHAALQDYNAAISTYSTGTEPNRRIVVAFNRSAR